MGSTGTPHVWYTHVRTYWIGDITQHPPPPQKKTPQQMLSKRGASDKATFGWGRAEVICALGNCAFLLGITLEIIVSTIDRLLEFGKVCTVVHAYMCVRACACACVCARVCDMYVCIGARRSNTPGPDHTHNLHSSITPTTRNPNPQKHSTATDDVASSSGLMLIMGIAGLVLNVGGMFAFGGHHHHLGGECSHGCVSFAFLYVDCTCMCICMGAFLVLRFCVWVV